MHMHSQDEYAYEYWSRIRTHFLNLTQQCFKSKLDTIPYPTLIHPLYASALNVYIYSYS